MLRVTGSNQTQGLEGVSGATMVETNTFKILTLVTKVKRVCVSVCECVKVMRRGRTEWDR